MIEKDRGIEIETPKPSRSIFARLLSIWANNRRAILVTVIAVALLAFFNALSSETRRALARGLWAHQSLIILLITFSLVTLSLLWSASQRFDAWIFLLFNLRGYHPLWLDRLMWALTQIGNGFLGILLGIFLYFAEFRPIAIQLLLGILSLWLVVEIIKAIVDRRRPFIVLEGTRVVGWRERGLSFPSGHTAQTFFMATLFAQNISSGVWVSMLLYGIAALVGLTRIYVGAHYPRDVIAGGILGSVWGILSVYVHGYLSTGAF